MPVSERQSSSSVERPLIFSKLRAPARWHENSNQPQTAIPKSSAATFCAPSKERLLAAQAETGRYRLGLKILTSAASQANLDIAD